MDADADLKAQQKMSFLVSPHIESFNFFLGEGIQRAVENIDPIEIETEDNRRFTIWIRNVEIALPSKSNDAKLLPHECREGGFTYSAPAFITLVVQPSLGQRVVLQRPFGRIPVMVRSNKCWLNGLKPAEMVAQREDATEPGGYFIVNGIEKLIRLLVVTRANYVMAVVRQAYQKRGSSYSTMGTLIRCVRPDSTSVTVTLHYLHEGLCNVKFMIQKQEFFVPVVLMLRALVPCSDREVYERLVQGDWENTFLTERAELNIREVKRLGLYAHEDCLAYLGRAFRVVLALPARLSDEEAGRVLLRRYVFVHLETDVRAKFDLLVLMFRKLLALVRGDIQEDNFDSPANQELLLGGHLYTALFKEKLQDWLLALRGQILRDLRQAPAAAATVDLTDPAYMSRVVTRCGDLGRKLEYFLATGNLRTNTGLDLMQVSGFCIIAERLNYLRFLSHLRCVHRGSFFAEMKTTSVRKLLPDSWGFLCPVHTPDGAPCGLLNHLSSTCRVVTEPAMGAAGARALAALLASLGMQQAAEEALVPPRDYLPVCLDGRVLGHVSPALAPLLAERLRLHKVLGTAQVPAWLEIALLPPERGGAYPGLYLFSGPARMMRPVANLRAGGRTELIGSLEQLYLDVACLEADLRPGRTSHRELKPTQVLSVVANLTPFCDFNQSPRNMYQCQMGKQTMGTPFHCFPHRADNKVYRIQMPQRPLVRTEAQDEFQLDRYPQGTNAIVAVVSYTGYDMEDAMIINKASYERGFQHGSVYKTEEIDLEAGQSAVQRRLGRRRLSNVIETPSGERRLAFPSLDADGLPPVGVELQPGRPLYAYLDETGRAHAVRFKGKENAYVEQVRLISEARANIRLRFNRNPVIGDKFSSRHGQKGVLSILWPQENMPFSESGLVPDLIINPNAFPSRMTIGMLVESLAGKAGALHGCYQDATAFRFAPGSASARAAGTTSAVDYFGEQLRRAGFSYWGSEPMYSGIYGCEFEADIYIGVVYYQRLRHMVKDKFQVRATGPINNLTRQPIKGRKLGGGIRFGEMERDSLLAHGASFLLHDRLMNSSDQHRAYVCARCGSLLAPSLEHIQATSERRLHCRYCRQANAVRVVSLPFVFRYLAVELAAMNIRIVLDVK